MWLILANFTTFRFLLIFHREFMPKPNPTFIFSFLWKSLLMWCFITLLSCKSTNTFVQNASTKMTEQEITILAQKIHEEALVLDAHADIATPTISPTFLSADGLSKVDITKLTVGGVGAVVMSVAVAPGPRTAEGDAAARTEANEKLTIVNQLIKESEGTLVLSKSVADLVKAKANNQISFILGFQNARSLEKNVSTIDSFYNAGVRIFGLNHLGHNDFSDSSRPFFDGETGRYEPDSEHGGLSTLGKAAVKRLNQLGAIIDVSQLSKQATLQTLALTTAPVIASHSNVLAISDVTRNISDEEIDLIGKNGGVVHIAPFRAYLLGYSDPNLVAEIKTARRAAGVSEKYSYPFELYWEIADLTKRYAFLKSVSDIIGPADVDNLIDHIDYVVKRIGINHVGIGTDFNHGSGIDGYVDAADALNVTIGLVQRGYSAKDIEKIWGGNFLRVFKAVEKKSSNK